MNAGERVAQRHMAVVPISAVDRDTNEALRYAASLAPEVLALHMRQASDADGIQDDWTRSGICLPLVIVDASGGDCTRAFHRALEVLKRSEWLDQITVVLPAHRASGAASGDWQDALTSDSGVIVRRVPVGDQGAA